MADRSDFLQSLHDIATKAEAVAKAAGEQLGAAADQAYAAVAPTIDDVTQQVADFTSQAYTAAETQVGEAAEFLKGQAASVAGDAAQALSLDEIGRKLASLGAPAIAFAVAASIAGGMGLAGAAVVTTALAMLGGPAGMVGGLITLGLLTVIADAVGKYGIEAILHATFVARREQGISIEQIHQEIDGLWISDELKYKLKTLLAMPQA